MKIQEKYEHGDETLELSMDLISTSVDVYGYEASTGIFYPSGKVVGLNYNRTGVRKAVRGTPERGVGVFEGSWMEVVWELEGSWKSVGNQLEISWKSVGNQLEISWNSVVWELEGS